MTAKPATKLVRVTKHNPCRKRGPKSRDLPIAVIEGLSSEGLGAEAIASLLKDRGVKVGFRTVARILDGQRVQV
jgi:hypothetical protein